MTFLAIDIGNTRLKWAQYDTPRPGAQLLAQGAEFLENIDRLADGPWAGLTPPSAMLGCVVAGEGVIDEIQDHDADSAGQKKGFCRSKRPFHPLSQRSRYAWLQS